MEILGVLAVLLLGPHKVVYLGFENVVAHSDSATVSWDLDFGRPTFFYLSVLVQKKIDFPIEHSGSIVVQKFGLSFLVASPVPCLVLGSALTHE